MAQLGSAVGLGPTGRRFESSCPDHALKLQANILVLAVPPGYPLGSRSIREGEIRLLLCVPKGFSR